MIILKAIIFFFALILTFLCFADGVNHIIASEKYMPIKEFVITSLIWSAFYLISCFY